MPLTIHKYPTLTRGIFVLHQPFRRFPHVLLCIASSFNADNLGAFERGTLPAGALLFSWLAFLLAKTLPSSTENYLVYTKLLFDSFPRLNRIPKPGRKRAYRLWSSPIFRHLQFCDIRRVRKRTPQTMFDMPRGNNCDIF